MIDYRFQGRLTYIGGGLNVQMSAWPVGGNWWEPSGSFTCVAAYQAKGAASLAASYVNLANPGTNNAAPGTAPDFDTSYGWDFNGSSTYLTTGLLPNQDWSAIVRFSDSGSANNYLFGVGHFDSGNQYGIRVADGYNSYYFYNVGVIAAGTPYLSSGVAAIAGKAACYLDGNSIAGATSGTYTWSTELYIGGRIQPPYGVGGYTTARIQAIAFYSTTLNATQVGEITTAMNAL